jgi:hypothetical protein
MELINQAKRKLLDEIKESVILDFIEAHDREPRDDMELADWCGHVAALMLRRVD